ncbi:MAG: hypothetical protein HRU23_14720 [Gammaproteobacteria bacterium]|nr:hypothetical protein [Gammaproteobacteria bacterium]
MLRQFFKLLPLWALIVPAVKYTFTIATLILAFTFTTQAQQQSSLQFSGFGRLIAGVSQYDNTYVQEYNSNATIKNNSLIALQADWQIAPNLALTSQIVGYLNDNKESGLEWLYLNYQASATTRIKLGQLRTPFFNYSDVLDVGYAYPWIVPPSEVYASYFFSHYDGINVIRSFDYDYASTVLEAYAGTFNGPIVQDNRISDVELDYLAGFSVQTTFDNLTMRAAINIGKLNHSQPRFQPSFNELRQYFEPVQLGSLIDDVELKGSYTFSQLGFSYDRLDYFIKGEWTHYKHDLVLIPTSTSYYLTLGYQLNDFLFHITQANLKDSLKLMTNTISTAPQYAMVRAIYQELIDLRVSGQRHSVTVGTRWDFAANMALKADVSRISYRTETPVPATNDTVLMVGFEWVF